MQDSWIILSSLFILVKTVTYVTNVGENKISLYGGSQLAQKHFDQILLIQIMERGQNNIEPICAG